MKDLEENGLSEDSEELYEHYRLVADQGQDVMRIDKFLMDRIPNTSRNKIQMAAKSGNILVNNRPVKQNYKIKPGDTVSIVLPYPVRQLELIAQDIPIDILTEDEQYIIVNKQPGMVVHPGYGNYSGTLVNALLHHFGELPPARDGEPVRPGLVHRLDKNTSGVMVVAKTEEALTNLSKQFFDRSIDRRYQALVWGDIKQEEGEIEGHIGRSPKDRKVMTVFPEGDQGKYALTRYKVLERFGYVTLVECKLETGRTHQIRVHFKHIGHPLFNDPEYGGDRILRGTTFSKYKQFVQNCFQALPRQALHAKTLEFAHPVTGDWVTYHTDLPDDMLRVLEKWRGYVQNNLQSE